jgi:HK97 family phage prohead protease
MPEEARTERQIRHHATAFTAGREQRADGSGEALYIEGYFAVFNETYELWPGATESIAEGAFTEALKTCDVRGLVNHNDDMVLGRTKSGTLTLREDKKGLWGRIEINPDDSDAMNLYARVKRADVDQCSFGFWIAEQKTDFKEDGTIHWTILRVDPLYEVSPCTFPAYEGTSVAARKREFEQIKKRKDETWREKQRKRLKEA